MNRSELVNKLADELGQVTRRDCVVAVDAILDAITSALARGHRIEIRGFGTFSVGQRASRMARNPRSGESVAIAETRTAQFKAAKALRETVRGLPESP